MRILLIIYDQSLDSDILKDRIKSLGPCYAFWDNHWFVQTDQTTKDVYERIASNEFETTSILVVEMSNGDLNYYGRMDINLWEWLKDK